MPLSISILLVLSIWQLAASCLGLPRVVLPGPFDVVEAFRQHGGYVIRNVGITTLEAVGGFLIGGLLATFCACVFVQSNSARRALYPLALMLKTTPLIVLAPLLVIWLGSGISSKIVMAGILAFFPILVAAYDGLRLTDQSMIELFHMHGAGPVDILFQVRFPFALPQLFSGMRVSVPLAVVGAVIGEYTGAAYGVGQVIASASYHLETSLVFASIFAISVVSLSLFGAVCLAEWHFVFWTGHSKLSSYIS